jgi:hypothetical protein
MAGEAELVMLGIQAAIRINEQYRKGFADSVRSNAITVPLPNFNPAPNLATAITFYTVGGGVEFVAKNARVSALIAKVQASGALSLLAEESSEFFALFGEHNALLVARNGNLITTDNSSANPAAFSNEDVLSLLELRQWRKGQNPNPSMLQRMAGTFISIGVAYLANDSQLASTNSVKGKALLGFLQAIEPINFAEGAPSQIVEQLFVAAIETVRDNASLVSSDKWAQTLVHDVAAGLFDDAKKLTDAEAGNLSGQERIGRWTQLIFRSVLKSAGDSALNHPDIFFAGLNAGQADVVSRVGRALLGAGVGQDGDHLDHLFTPETLDAIAKASFAAVAAHPELVAHGNDRLQKLIGSIPEELASAPALLTRDFVPEAIRIILEKTGENLDALMPAGQNPSKNLLLVASKEVLALIIAPAPAGAVWKLRFGPAQIEEVLRTVIDAVAANPAWLVNEAGGANSLLGGVTKDVIEVLRTRTGPLLRPDTGIAILKASYGAVSRSLQFAAKDPANKRLIADVLDAVFTTVFGTAADSRAAWLLLRDDAVVRLTSVVLDALGRHGITPVLIAIVKTELTGATQTLDAGKPWSIEGFAESLDKALAAA